MADVSGDPGTALVVGGASGIGRACVEALAAEGHVVVVADLSEAEPLDGIAGRLRVDVRDAEQVRRAVAEVAGSHGAPRTVVFAAGTARVTPLLEIEPREWDLVLGVNLSGAFNVLQAAGRAMDGGGSIILLSSIDSQSPVAGLGHYCAAKAGLEALARSAALELGPRGIRCNAVAPGVVATPLMAPMLARPEVREAFVRRTPLGRVGDVDDIADVVTFLASPAARWITGACLVADGGLSLREHPDLPLDTPDLRKDPQP